MIEKIDKTVYRCTCELSDCGKSWTSYNACPGRCRWCGRRLWNGQDMSRKHLITAQGKTQNISSWAREIGLSPQTICARLKAGWTEEDAVSVPARKKANRKEKP